MFVASRQTPSWVYMYASARVCALVYTNDLLNIVEFRQVWMQWGRFSKISFEEKTKKQCAVFEFYFLIKIQKWRINVLCLHFFIYFTARINLISQFYMRHPCSDMWSLTGLLLVVVVEWCCCLKGRHATFIFDKILNFTLMNLELSLLKINVNKW